MASPDSKATTQEFLDIHDITNDLVILKDGTTSLIITVSAMNFGLLAEEEQDSIIYAYAGLLNSLNYHIQIIVRSQTKDVTSYLTLLEEQSMKATTPQNRDRIRRYQNFVANLIHERNVLDKKFYVVIPASPLELGLLSASSVIPGKQTFDVNSVERSVLLDKAKNILEPKRDHLISQFARIGLYSRQIKTQEIIQYFYVSYNPEATEGQKIDDSNSYTTPLVKASFEGYYGGGSGSESGSGGNSTTGGVGAVAQEEQAAQMMQVGSEAQVVQEEPGMQGVQEEPVVQEVQMVQAPAETYSDREQSEQTSTLPDTFQQEQSVADNQLTQQANVEPTNPVSPTNINQ